MTHPREIHLISRPTGLPSSENFALCSGPIPELKKGEVLVRALYLSVDPYMRGRIGGRPSSHAPFPLHQPAQGEGVGLVVASKHGDYREGDSVCGILNWADYSAVSSDSLWKFDAEEHAPSVVLSTLGMPAMTAYFGLLDIGKPKPGDTLVVSAAAGAVGTLVGQIAKIFGCRVVGIAGSEAKVHYLRNTLHFDAAINYKKAEWIPELQSACASGVDIYFDNVGGGITDEVMKWLNRRARVVLCGQIASYNLEQPDIGPRNFRHLIVKSAMAKGFLVIPDYQERFGEAREQLQMWLKQKKITPSETIVKGLENLPKAFIGLFLGTNLGKQLVQV